MNRQTVLSLLVFSGCLCLLFSCVQPVNSFTSPRFAELQLQIDHNPAPDAIAGMWHREDRPGLTDSAVSILFRRNLEGMIVQNLVGHDWGLKKLEPVNFTYSYLGNGCWQDIVGNLYWLANGYLLRQARIIPMQSVTVPGEEFTAADANMNDVFVRVE
jgi:hypothetical protein